MPVVAVLSLLLCVPIVDYHRRRRSVLLFAIEKTKIMNACCEKENLFPRIITRCVVLLGTVSTYMLFVYNMY